MVLAVAAPVAAVAVLFLSCLNAKKFLSYAMVMGKHTVIQLSNLLVLPDL